MDRELEFCDLSGLTYHFILPHCITMKASYTHGCTGICSYDDLLLYDQFHDDRNIYMNRGFA